MKENIKYIIITGIVVALITWYATSDYYSNLKEKYEDSQIRIENLEKSLNSKMEEIKKKDAQIEKLSSDIEHKDEEIASLKISPLMSETEKDLEEVELDLTDNYVLNKKTKKFHYKWCSSINNMKESNKKTYKGTRDEIIDMGYSPCKKCNP